MNHLLAPTRNLFFTGKGGVGKTSIACASAVRLADAGKRVLLVSTDPASNLDEVLDASLGHHPTAVPGVPGLWAMNIDPASAAAEYRERMVGPYRKLLPASAISSMEEQFSGSCTLEIAAFDEFARLLGDASATCEFDHVIFDTAPTGHTLRLLTLPSAWAGFVESNTSGATCIGPLAGLEAQQEIYRATVKALCDAETTTLVLVARPESTSLREAARTRHELAALGVVHQQLVVNGVFAIEDKTDRYAMALQVRGKFALDSIPAELKSLPRTEIPLRMGGLQGISDLRLLGEAAHATVSRAEDIGALDLPPPLSSLIDDLAAPGHGVILAMGKGGVGKTTIASAVAIALAERGHRVHLTTTDPAAHVASTVLTDALPHLTIGRIDPAIEVARYTAQVMATAGATLDLQGKSLLAEDLRSPCTEEIAVFRAFAEAVAEGAEQFVVLDTAPTGHTILLLDAAMSHHRELARQSAHASDSVEQLLPRLRDPLFTRVLIVTLPEATPVHEAASLQADLRRASIEPFAWVINQSFSPLSVTDAGLAARRSSEASHICEVTQKYAARATLVAWQPEPPLGPTALRKLVGQDRVGRELVASVPLPS